MSEDRIKAEMRYGAPIITPEMISIQRAVNEGISMQAETILARPVKPLKWWERVYLRVWRWFR